MSTTACRLLFTMHLGCGTLSCAAFAKPVIDNMLNEMTTNVSLAKGRSKVEHHDIAS
jgi:hypothetical protein